MPRRPCAVLRRLWARCRYFNVVLEQRRGRCRDDEPHDDIRKQHSGDDIHHLLEADTVITAFGLIQNETIIRELAGMIPESHVIGDSNRVGSIAGANIGAFNVVVEI
jgi:hypothetical protein